MKELLFICTGNFYRSRFAEGLFNHLCASKPIGWQAFSRGLAIHMVQENRELSLYTAEAFARLKIPATCSGACRVSLTEAGLQRANRIIALKEQEHRPMMQEQFPQWADHIEYWGVHDLDVHGPEIALPQIESQVRELYRSLAASTHTQQQ